MILIDIAPHPSVKIDVAKKRCKIKQLPYALQTTAAGNMKDLPLTSF